MPSVKLSILLVQDSREALWSITGQLFVDVKCLFVFFFHLIYLICSFELKRSNRLNRYFDSQL